MKWVYLAHGNTRKEYGHSLQVKIEALGIKVYNPFDEVEQFNPLKSQEEQTTAESLVEKEFYAIENVVDAMVTIVTDDWAAGSHMESVWSSRHCRKPTFVLWLAKRYSRLTEHHVWYDYLTSVYETEDALLAALKEWAERA